MTCSELRLMITDLSPSIGFIVVPELEDGTGWKLTAFTDCVNTVDVRYYHVAVPPSSDFNFTVKSDAMRAEWWMADAKGVAQKVVDLLTTQTLN